MANYLLVYHGGSMPETPEAQAAVMGAWTKWFETIGPALVDGGNPASQSKTVSSAGGVGGPSSNPPTGYSIIKADGIDAAVAIARGCPVLQGGASVEVVETFNAM